MKFTKLYENLKLLDICKPVSPEEAKKRDEIGPEIRIKEILDTVEKTKLPDGTWHVHDTLDVSNSNLSSLNTLNVSIVDEDFICFYNKLTSLDGCPKIVKGDFWCNDNELISLKGCPTQIGMDFYSYNNRLTSLEGCPVKVGGDFFCNNNKLTSLEGCPTNVGRNFNCSDNVLTSLDSGPTKIGRTFDCGNNNLTSIKGCPTKVGRSFMCYDNAKKFTVDEVRAICDVKGVIGV